MTTASERTRSVLQTGVFLEQLRLNTALPEAVRQEANRLLRHYPTKINMIIAAKQERMADFPFREPMFTPDIEVGWTQG